MRRRLTCIAATAALLVLPLGTTPADAAVTTSGCKNTIFPGAELGWYPAVAGSASALQIACFFDSRTGSSTVASKFTIHDAKNIQYNTGAALTVWTSSPALAGATCVSVAELPLFADLRSHPISEPASSLPTGLATYYLAPHTNIAGAGPGVCLPSDYQIILSKPTAHAIPSNTPLLVENGTARTVDDGITAGGSCLFTSTQAHFMGGEAGSISGTNLGDYTTYTGVSPTQAVLSPCATNAIAHGNETLTIRPSQPTSSLRSVDDGNCGGIHGTDIYSASAAFDSADLGLMFATPFDSPPEWSVSAVVSPTHIQVSSVYSTLYPTACAFFPSGPFTFTLGEASRTAPHDGETVATITAQLDLDPALVPGANACALDDPETISLTGTWLNPSLTGPFASGQPAGTKAIGAIQFGNGILSFNAYVIEREAGTVTTPPDPIGVKHDDIVFPNAPFSSVMCASATSPGLGLSVAVVAATASQSALQGRGVGTPDTTWFRATQPKTGTAGFNSVIYFYDDDNPRIWLPAANFNRLCIIAADPAPEAFTCGDG